MTVHIDVLKKIEEHLKAAWGDLSQAAKEALAIESYRTERLSVGGVAEMLGLSVLEAEEFLKKHGIDMPYTLEDLEADRAALKRILPQ